MTEKEIIREARNRFSGILHAPAGVLLRRRLTVTHPEASRFFMLIPEAAGLILQAGSMGGAGRSSSSTWGSR